jgi:hypothetical protein
VHPSLRAALQPLSLSSVSAHPNSPLSTSLKVGVCGGDAGEAAMRNGVLFV